MLPKYCESVFQTRRRPTRTIHVGIHTSVLQRLGIMLCSGCPIAPAFTEHLMSRDLVRADWECGDRQRAPRTAADHDHHRCQALC